MQGVTAIVVLTASGSSARLVSRYRPPVPIFTFTGSTGAQVVAADQMVKLLDHILLASA